MVCNRTRSSRKKMSGHGRKIASNAVKNRKSTPLFGWIRDKLLAVNRDLTKTPPPGVPSADGKCQYLTPMRFPNTQSTKSPDLPNIPGGIHHKLADNYYYQHDGRRAVEPPKICYKANADVEPAEFKHEISYEKVSSEISVAVNRGPKENFGLSAVTPGFGYEWNRRIEYEEETQKNDKNLKFFQRFDHFKK